MLTPKTTVEISGSLSKLASLSSEAQDISDSLMRNVEQSEVFKLKSKLTAMAGEIARLQLQVAELSVEQPETLPATQVRRLLDGLSSSAAKATTVDLVSTYNTEFFTQLEPEDRLLFATKLIDVLAARKAVVPELWRTIVVRQGFN